MNTSTLGLLFAALTALSWSILAIGLKVALQYTDAETLVCFRMSIAFFAMLIFFFCFRPQSIAIIRKPPLLAVLGGILLACNFLGFTKFIGLTSPSIAQIFIQLSPLLFLCIGIFYFKESFSRVQVLGAVLALFGFFLFSRHSLETVAVEEIFPAAAWILFSVITWAIFASFQKILLEKNFHPQALNFVIYGIAAICLLPFSDLKIAPTWSPYVWILMIYLGLNTILAYGFLAEALKRAPANLVSITIILNPIITLFITTYLVKAAQIEWLEAEDFGFTAWLGALCVLAGVGITIFFANRGAQRNTN